MLRHKRNCHAIQTPSDDEHVKLSAPIDALHPLPTQSQSLPLPPLRQPLLPLIQLQRLNQRVTFSLELYHKNVIKKLPALKQHEVYKLTKNISQT
ncbi:uncharacterized protein LOC108155242 [Drosophila miranda]|uniref:Uncharacterized protein n=1 Tax=Drosophila pseudoobscura pseudoobscura TaxID=46245 RepID=A0A6I8UMQ9_DROPS|nr:uncharacterized protein LOC4800790 [Drosophila pseudoobscura]XP_017141420.1 uncharacterized protein LOC108155242 [Drosophila miranda]